MAETSYTYSISGDFPNQKIDEARMHQEIDADSSIVIACIGVNSKGDTCVIIFKDALTDQAPLDALVANHSGEPLEDPSTHDGKLIVHLDAPKEDDGKPVVVMTPGPSSYRTFFTGRGDDPSPTPPESGRGSGPEIGIDIPASDSFPKDYDIEWQYTEITYVHDGQLCWRDPVYFSRKDHFSFSIKGPATVVTVNGSNTGNCNLVDAGGYNIIVPAAGDGTHDVDLSTACPVPAGKARNGYWDLDKETGMLTPAVISGNAKWHLLDIAFQSYFLRCVSMIDWMGRFDIDTYMAEWISPKWTWRLDVHKEVGPAQDCEVAGWLYVFREKTS